VTPFLLPLVKGISQLQADVLEGPARRLQ